MANKYDRTSGVGAGSFVATLKSASVVDEPGYNFQSKKFDGPPESRWKWEFYILTKTKPVKRTRKHSLAVGKGSLLWKDLCQMSPREATEEVRTDDKKLDALIYSLIGNEFLITIEVGSTGYEKVTNVMALPEGHVKTLEQATKHSELTFPAEVIEDDGDIPF